MLKFVLMFEALLKSSHRKKLPSSCIRVADIKDQTLSTIILMPIDDNQMTAFNMAVVPHQNVSEQFGISLRYMMCISYITLRFAARTYLFLISLSILSCLKHHHHIIW